MEQLNERMHKELRDLGADIVGFGDISQLPPEQRLDMPMAVAVAVKYPKAVIRGISELPTVEYYEHYNALNERLDMLVTRGAELLTEMGYDAIAQTRQKVGDWRKGYKTRLPHKTVATRAGLGWIGKCAMLITAEYGSAVRLSSILTNAPFEAAQPIDSSDCGNCMVCTEACPSRAVSGNNWRKGMLREEFFDFRACAAATSERSIRGLGINAFICGKCIEICPRTRKYTME